MIASFFAAVALNSTIAAMPESGLESSLTKMSSISTSRTLSVSQKTSEISNLYAKNISKLQEDLGGLSDKDLHLIFTISDMTASYSQVMGYKSQYVYIRALNNDFEELDRRGVITDTEVSRAYEKLVGARWFKQAENIRLTHGKVALLAVPPVKTADDFDVSQPAVYSLSQSKESLVLHNVSLRAHYRIIVVAECHFARDAANAIVSDPILSQGFRKGNAIWIEGADGDLDLSQLQAWNSSFPHQPLSIAYDNTAWKGIDFSQSPKFLLFKDGVFVSERTGWSSETSKADLVSWLKDEGVLH